MFLDKVSVRPLVIAMAKDFIEVRSQIKPKQELATFQRQRANLAAHAVVADQMSVFTSYVQSHLRWWRKEVARNLWPLKTYFHLYSGGGCGLSIPAPLCPQEWERSRSMSPL